MLSTLGPWLERWRRHWQGDGKQREVVFALHISTSFVLESLRAIPTCETGDDTFPADGCSVRQSRVPFTAYAVSGTASEQSSYRKASASLQIVVSIPRNSAVAERNGLPTSSRTRLSGSGSLRCRFASGTLSPLGRGAPGLSRECCGTWRS